MRASTALVASIFLCTAASAEAGRQTISLNGTWQAAEGTMDEMPSAYEHQVPVPGLLDMATPPFASPGATVPGDKRGESRSYPADPRREAFWYRRVISLEGSVPEVALLKVHKAMFGTKVFLNGQTVGEHWPSFTPGYFDLSGRLKGDGQPNELVIRVGASLATFPRNLMSGWDNEKSRYIPGIYDSVELILSGTPRIESVQVAPNVEQGSARVQVELAASQRKGPANIVIEIREAKSRRVVGKTQVAVAADDTQGEAVVPIANARLWSPEDPFLYEAQVSTPGDELRTRFGMRSFRFDPATGQAMLNGRPYYLRGSNVCIYRFFEDSQRGNLPWNDQWVRRLHERFKDMHWNSLRYCIGFPPERWYEIADELGILIQDEAPIWFLGKGGNLPEAITAESLAGEYTEWLRERWNHPCVVIWDAQNETPDSPATGEAIERVRQLDLSNRPWDNGWSPAQAPSDMVECHPYRSSRPEFKLEDFATMDPVPNTRVPNAAGHALVINEYGWLWINRDGSLPTLTVDVYKRLLGEDATKSERFRYYARTLAAKTEFWRSHRKCAGVLHFCGLGYSRADGQTSDHWIDVDKLVYEPEFYRYVRDAFAPVGIMLDFWKSELPAASRQEFKVAVINDLEKPCQAAVRLRVLQRGKALTEQSAAVTVGPLGRQEVAIGVTLPERPGRYVVEAALSGGNGGTTRSLRDVRLTAGP